MDDFIRIIPCLDMKDQRIVKGINFVNMRDGGDPLEAAIKYEKAGADELVMLDIGSGKEREALLEMTRAMARAVDIPITVGGGVTSLKDMEDILLAGGSKVSINSQAVKNPSLVKEAIDRFGSKTMIIAVDGAKNAHGKNYEVHIGGGRINTGLDVVEWAKELESYGVGEVLLTSKDADGTKAGYDLELTSLVSGNTGMDIIASGGAGCLEDFYDVIEKGGARAVLAASLFHFGEISIGQLKSYLKGKGVRVR